MIGKCNIRVPTTKLLNANDGSGCPVLTALPTDIVAGTINTLKAKCINAINIIITNFFMV
jgi:hypothetical protein